MNLFQSMRIFVSVIEENGITAAADELKVSKGLVSKTITNLEGHLNAHLLVRTTRRVSLTESGSDYYKHCKVMLKQNRLAETRITNRSNEPSGVLKVNAPVSFGLQNITPVVAEFMETYPKVKIDLTLTDRYVDISSQEVDMLIRVGTKAPDTAVVKKICDSKHILVAAPKLIAKLGMPQRPSELNHWPLIEYSLRAEPFSWRRCKDLPNVVMRTNSGDTMLCCAVNGQGLAFLPGFIVDRAITNGDLVQLFPEQVEEASPVVAVFPHGGCLLPQKSRHFFDFIKEKLS